MVANINPRSDYEYNLSRIEDIVQTAHELDVDALVLPELAVSGYVWDSEESSTVRDHLRFCDNRQPAVRNILDRINDGLVDRGKGLKMVFLGNVRVDDRNDTMNDSVFVMAPGIDHNEVFYDKIFLTPLEKRYFNKGSDQRLVLDTRWGRFGVMICYDLCFVDLGRRYAFEDEVDLIISSAAWRTEAFRVYPLLGVEIDNYYQYIWNLMNAAMAAHNQVWSIGANCVGAFEKTGGLFCGESGVWGPSGLPLLHASHKDEELIIIRDVEIRGHMRHQATEHFDYRLDFDEVYRRVKDIKPRRVAIP